MLETERLIIRRFGPDELGAFAATRADDEVTRYLGGRELQTPEFIKNRFDFYQSCHEKYGFGMSALILKESGELIGACGIQPLDDTGEIEVGYSLIKEYWRRGIGYECALAWLKYAFEERKLPRIVAVAHPENIGSWRIMEKLGMKLEKRAFHYNMECVFYGISRDEFLRQGL